MRRRESSLPPPTLLVGANTGEEPMRDFRSSLLAAAVLGAAVLAATPAFAFHCPQEMANTSPTKC